MNILPTKIPEVVLLRPDLWMDDRGKFWESYRKDVFAKLGIDVTFVQENQSTSHQGVLRGLHYQLGRPQAKLVRVLQGEVFDVAVDIRSGSPTFGQWVGEFLSDANRRQMFIPIGFAHGFLTLTETAEFLYKCSDFYAPKEERGLRWNSPDVGIRWPAIKGNPILAERDAAYPSLGEIKAHDLPLL